MFGDPSHFVPIEPRLPVGGQCCKLNTLSAVTQTTLIKSIKAVPSFGGSLIEASSQRLRFAVDFDLPLPIPPVEVRVRPSEGRTDEASQLYGRADYRRLREHEAGAKAADLARKHGVSEATLYNWKAKFGGMDVSEAKRLRQLEDENAKLKKLLAEQMLDAAALRELLSKKW
jgi:putative transposase